MQLILRKGRVVDPSQDLDKVADIGIDDGHVTEIATRIRKKGRKEIDARGLIVMPGFIDMHVHLREPGREDAETIESGTNAAARGGFTAVACMPTSQAITRMHMTASLKLSTEAAPTHVASISAV